MKQTIYLNFIMKDESKVLTRMLESVIYMVDGCVCVDTGSEDDSRQIVLDFFKKHNKPCEVYDRKFDNFEASRNYALEMAKGKCDKLMWLDCDEELKIQVGFNIDQFKEELSGFDSALMPVSYNEGNYVRVNFFNPEKFKWNGKVHEYLDSEAEVLTLNKEGFKTLVHVDGASWNNIKEKYLHHAHILEMEVKLNNDPRDVFYLAQSYRDAGELESSIEWYRKRVEMKEGFEEERYAAQLQIGIIMAQLGHNYRDVIHEWMKCSSLDIMKAEHIFYVITELQAQGEFELSYIYSSYALRMFHGKYPYPNRALLLRKELYDGLILITHLENCSKTGRFKELANIKSKFSSSNIQEEVDVCILSNAKTDELKKVTMDSIRTLLSSEANVKFNVYVVEGNESVNYDSLHVKTLHTWMEFNYNGYMNFAMKSCKSKYIALCNNDLEYTKGWASSIIQEMNKDKDLLSASPFCPGVNELSKENIQVGTEVRKHLNGWCIFVKREAIEKIGGLDESVQFWYSDDIYSDQLNFHRIKHALVNTSIVYHHENKFGKTAEVLSEAKKQEYMESQSYVYLKAKQKYKLKETA